MRQPTQCATIKSIRKLRNSRIWAACTQCHYWTTKHRGREREKKNNRIPSIVYVMFGKNMCYTHIRSSGFVTYNNGRAKRNNQFFSLVSGELELNARLPVYVSHRFIVPTAALLSYHISFLSTNVTNCNDSFIMGMFVSPTTRHCKLSQF